MTVTKLGIGTVTKGEMEAQTAFSLITAIQNAKVPIQMLLAMGCYIHHNRDIVVKQAIENNCSHLLFVDSDVLFDQWAIRKLIDDDKDIVGGRYNKRILPIESTVKQDITELSVVPFIPAGFMLVNVEVYKKIGQPYFSFDDKSDSDDLYFCNKATAAGYQIWCDPTIQIGHLGQAVF